MRFLHRGQLLIKDVDQCPSPVRIVMSCLYNLYDTDLPRIDGHLGAIRPVDHDQAGNYCCDC